MEKGWEHKKLGDLASFINGDRSSNYPSGTDFVDNGIPFINAGHLSEGIIDFTKMNYITQSKYESLRSGKIKENDILFCLRGSLGKSAIVPKGMEGAIASSLVIIRSNCANSFYLKYFLNSNIVERNIQRSNNGSSQPNLSAKSVMEFSVPVPPIQIQNSVVEELDKINELIRLKKEQLKDYDNLAQSIFYEMFGDPVVNEKGWEVKKLGEVCECITDGDHMPPPKSDTGIPFVTIGNVNKASRQIDFDNTYFVPRDYFDNIPNIKKPRRGDVLYTVTGSYGIPIIINYDKEFCFQRHIGLLRPKDFMSPVFLCMWALNDRTKGQADMVATGIAQKTVSLKSLRNFAIILPPLPLQQLFAQRIELIEQQKAEIQSTIADLETLLASRMQYWFD